MHLGLVHEGALLASTTDTARRHREGAQGGHADASGDGHAEVGVLAEVHVDVDHCDHLLRAGGRRLCQGRVCAGVLEREETYRGRPVSGNRFFGYFRENLCRISRWPEYGPPAASSSGLASSSAPSVARRRRRRVDVSPPTRASTSSPYFVSLDWPMPLIRSSDRVSARLDLGDRLQRQVGEHDVRRHLLLGRAGHPPLPQPLEQLLVVRRRAVLAPADLALGACVPSGLPHSRQCATPLRLRADAPRSAARVGGRLRAAARSRKRDGLRDGRPPGLRASDQETVRRWRARVMPT